MIMYYRGKLATQGEMERMVKQEIRYAGIKLRQNGITVVQVTIKN